MRIRIATRKSALALWQARHVAAKLGALDTVDDVTLVPLSTRGDEVLDKSLQKIGGKGLFIKELEVAMQNGDADIAVHSMKDVPAVMPDGFLIAAVLERENPADALVSRDGAGIDGLAEGATIGSSSLRRQAQLLAMRPDLCIEPLRGNVNTRLDKLDAGKYDAIVLAAAGLARLGLASRISQAFEPGQMLPAAAQGVVGIECLSAHESLVALLSGLNDPSSVLTTAAERAVAATLDASCQSPLASYATLDGSRLTIATLAAAADGSRVLRAQADGPATDTEAAAALGERAARQLLEQGAADLLHAEAT